METAGGEPEPGSGSEKADMRCDGVGETIGALRDKLEGFEYGQVRRGVVAAIMRFGISATSTLGLA